MLPEPSWVLIVIGSFPFVARLAPKLGALDITRPVTAVVCGVVVTAAQLFAGASGPLLDVFYLRSPLNRHQIVASKAVTQTLGHVLKLVYYGGIVGTTETLSPYFLIAAVGMAVLGTRLGTRLIDRIDEFLGHPETDPHGDPIPTAEGHMRGVETALVPLSTCSSKTRARIARVTNQQPDFLRHLADHGLNLGTTVTVEDNSAEAGIVTARVGKKSVTLGHPAAEQLLVEVLE